MPEAAERHRDQSDVLASLRRSLHERVMADPSTRHSYFNRTQGLLTGDPAHDDMNKVLKILDDYRIVFLYDPDANRPRPTFYSPGRISVGLTEISLAAKRLAPGP